MRSRIGCIATIVVFLLASSEWSTAGDLTKYVDPFLGTGGHGHTYPGATVPFGMVQLSPDNGRGGWDWCSGYHYSEDRIIGFSHTHLSGTGCADLGDILLMPTTSGEALKDGYASKFSHDDEAASPGYYRVKLLDDNILVELTATDHAGFHRYTFPVSDSSRLLINLKRGQDDNATATRLQIVNPTLVVGYRFSNGWAPDQRVFFAARFSRPIVSAVMVDSGSAFRPAREAAGNGVRALLLFGPSSPDKPLLVKVGISSASEEGARKNLDAEIHGWEFDAVRAAARQAWEKELEKVKIETPDEATKTVFYTAMYHAFLAPTEFSDVDGTYRGADGKIHVAKKGLPYYSTYSLWDTYRAAHPLYTIVQPGRVNGMMECMLAFARESGYLPVWQLAANETNCMVGYHAVPPLADAYLKGFRGFNAATALRDMERSATRDHRGLRYYSEQAPTDIASQLLDRKETTDMPPLPEGTVVMAGYDSSVSGESMGYHSSDPTVNRALIARATDGKSIEWKTGAVPPDAGQRPRAYVWMAGIGTAKGAHAFTLSLNGDSLLAFHTASTPAERHWTVTGKNGARLSFDAEMADDFGDLFGNLLLVLPSGMETGTTPVTLRITGQRAESGDWVMTFEHPLQEGFRASNEYGVIRRNGREFQLLRVDYEHLGRSVEATVHVAGMEPVRAALSPGHSTVYLMAPKVESDQMASVQIDGVGPHPVIDSLLILPVRPIDYVPADKDRESVSKTLEYAVDDFCIGQMAGAMGKKADAATYTARAEYFRHLFDPSTGFFRGKTYGGKWVTPFNPRFGTEKQPEYTEGNAWQYLWLVPQDVNGLIGLLGGREKFDQRLDSLFDQSSDLSGTGATADVSGLIGLYAHGNEPSHHIAYLYDYDGNPWKTQALVHRIMTEFYKTGPDGLCGNEDCGQMSAWYVLSAMGFYQVTPAGGVLVIGSPLVEKASINVGHGKTFTITAKNFSASNFYIQSATLNGKKLDRPWFTYFDLMKGGTLALDMGPEPNKAWGSAVSAMPPMVPPR
jgi:putative alpha-1,2-mannosidase